METLQGILVNFHKVFLTRFATILKRRKQKDTRIGHIKPTGRLHVTHMQPVGLPWPNICGGG
jgi:hypothetical protein